MKRGAWSALLALALTGCAASSGPPAPSSASRSTPPAASPAGNVASPPASAGQQRYAAAVLRDRPSGLWTLTDVAGLRAGDAVEDASPAASDGDVIEGSLQSTDGPAHEPAARFNGTGRIVTPGGTLLRPGRPFTLEFFFRADDCSRRWTQVLGTASYTRLGRQGINVLHYPRSFSSRCHLAVEFWRNDGYVGGCGPAAVARPGVWLHFALTYDGRTGRCFADGRMIGSAVVPVFGFESSVPFGIGGAGGGYARPLDSGSLADVALYPRALGAADLQRHVAAMAS